MARVAKRIGVLMVWIAVMLNASGATPPVKIANPFVGATAQCGGGTMSGIAVSSTKAGGDGTYAYQPGFDTSRWGGSLKKLKLALDDATGTVGIAAAADWDAGEILTGGYGQAASPRPDARKIYTAKIGSDLSLQTVEFKWTELADSQRALLNASPVDGKGDGLGPQRVNYLRGTRDLELGQANGIFRIRNRVLGDIIHSNATYVGAPALNVQGPGYQQFYDAQKARAGAVYAGANDGMLHAFSAADGTELFSYIPNVLMPGLNQLTMPGYMHRPYVDGAMSAAEARVAGHWKTVLASGMGGGAQGVFALDVTDPSGFGEGMGAIWEFTDSDDADMGNLVSAPLIAKFKTKTVGGVPEYKYFVVLPSGLNNYSDDGKGRFDAAASGALFLLSLDKAPSAKWKLGVNYYKFSLPLKDASLQNGVSSPALVTGSDGAVRYAYAGDLQGNLWRLDFTGAAPWSSAFGSASSTPLFTAMDNDGVRQPITAQPRVAFAPGGGYVVLFGTGKFLEDADASAGNFNTQSFYGIYDSSRDADKVTGRSQLAARALTNSGSDGYAVEGSEFEYGGSKKGWYVDFPDSGKTGERGTTSAVLAYGRVFFNTLIPAAVSCGAGGGRAYALDALTGLSVAATGSLSGAGLPGSPVIMETGMSEIGERNATGKRTVKKKIAIVNFGTGSVQGTTVSGQNGVSDVSVSAGRFSWREILNWLELRAAKF